MTEISTQAKQKLLFDDPVEQSVPCTNSDLTQATIGGSALTADNQEQPQELQSQSTVTTVETVTFDMTKKEDVLQCVDNALGDLEQALARGHSDALKGYLKFLSGFHNYSFRNMMLIFM